MTCVLYQLRVPKLIYSAQSDLISMDIYALCCLLRVYIRPNKESWVRFLEHFRKIRFWYDSNYLPKASLFEISCSEGEGQGINTTPSRNESVIGHSMLFSVGGPNSTSTTHCSQSHGINTVNQRRFVGVSSTSKKKNSTLLPGSTYMAWSPGDNMQKQARVETLTVQPGWLVMPLYLKVQHLVANVMLSSPMTILRISCRASPLQS